MNSGLFAMDGEANMSDTVKLYKLIIFNGGNVSVRVYDVIPKKSTYLVSGKFIKASKILVPDSNLLDEYFSGYIFCFEADFDKAATILREWMRGRAKALIEKWNDQIQKCQSYLENEPEFDIRTAKLRD